MTPRFDPHWPFPQYDNNGRRLLPPGWGKKDPTHNPRPYPGNAQPAPF